MGEDVVAEDARPAGAAIDYDNPPFPLTTSDREQLALRDEDFQPHTWDELQALVATNRLEQLKRRPSDLRRYLAWSHATKQQYGSITHFVVRQRLRWTPLTLTPPTFAHDAARPPFADPASYAVLRNDWPYGFAPGITHLLVWSKTPIAVDEARGGDMTPEARRLVDDFVTRYFVHALPGRVLWFKNWAGLQSVRGVDHVHVLVRDVPDEVMDKWCERRDL